MVRSMTGFGRCRETVDGLDITVEIKSVNSRFLDCNTKISRAYGYLEERVKPYLLGRGISRGKIDIWIGIEVLDSGATEIGLDEGYLRGYLDALYRLRDEYGLRDDISVMSVARNSDVFRVTKPEEDIESDWQALCSVLDPAIDSFIAAREREGANIARDLLSKVDAIEVMVDEIDKLSQSDTLSYREKLEERLREMLSDNRIVFDENRILTECAIFADKIAIDEELVRLRSHFEAFRSIFESSEPVGRRLDFLTQELNREINTIGSKSANSAITRKVVDVKCELEKIREQIQNIE